MVIILLRNYERRLKNKMLFSEDANNIIALMYLESMKDNCNLDAVRKQPEINYLDMKTFTSIVKQLSDEHYIQNANFAQSSKEVLIAFLSDASLTNKGKRYVEQNLM